MYGIGNRAPVQVQARPAVPDTLRQVCSRSAFDRGVAMRSADPGALLMVQVGHSDFRHCQFLYESGRGQALVRYIGPRGPRDVVFSFESLRKPRSTAPLNPDVYHLGNPNLIQPTLAELPYVERVWVLESTGLFFQRECLGVNACDQPLIEKDGKKMSVALEKIHVVRERVVAHVGPAAVSSAVRPGGAAPAAGFQGKAVGPVSDEEALVAWATGAAARSEVKSPASVDLIGDKTSRVKTPTYKVQDFQNASRFKTVSEVLQYKKVLCEIPEEGYVIARVKGKGELHPGTVKVKYRRASDGRHETRALALRQMRVAPDKVGLHQSDTELFASLQHDADQDAHLAQVDRKAFELGIRQSKRHMLRQQEAAEAALQAQKREAEAAFVGRINSWRDRVAVIFAEDAFKLNGRGPLGTTSGHGTVEVLPDVFVGQHTCYGDIGDASSYGVIVGKRLDGGRSQANYVELADETVATSRTSFTGRRSAWEAFAADSDRVLTKMATAIGNGKKVLVVDAKAQRSLMIVSVFADMFRGTFGDDVPTDVLSQVLKAMYGKAGGLNRDNRSRMAKILKRYPDGFCLRSLKDRCQDK